MSLRNEGVGQREIPLAFLVFGHWTNDNLLGLSSHAYTMGIITSSSQGVGGLRATFTEGLLCVSPFEHFEDLISASIHIGRDTNYAPFLDGNAEAWTCSVPFLTTVQLESDRAKI